MTTIDEPGNCLKMFKDHVIAPEDTTIESAPKLGPKPLQDALGGGSTAQEDHPPARCPPARPENLTRINQIKNSSFRRACHDSDKEFIV